MAEREIRLLGQGSQPGTMRIDDGLGGAGSLVPASASAGGIQVRLPGGSVITVASQADVEIIKANLQLMQQQQVVDLSGGAGGGGWSNSAVAEAGLTAAEFFSGMSNNRLVKKTKEARRRYRAARNALRLEILGGMKDTARLATLFENMWTAMEDAERYQDEICAAMANMAYVRAAGGALKTYSAVKGNAPIFGNMGAFEGAALGLGGGLIIAKLLGEDDDAEDLGDGGL